MPCFWLLQLCFSLDYGLIKYLCWPFVKYIIYLYLPLYCIVYLFMFIFYLIYCRFILNFYLIYYVLMLVTSIRYPPWNFIKCHLTIVSGVGPLHSVQILYFLLKKKNWQKISKWRYNNNANIRIVNVQKIIKLEICRATNMPQRSF